MELEYWALVDIPRQDRQEPVGTYVLRCAAALEKAMEGAKTAAKHQQDEDTHKELMDRLGGIQNEIL